MSRSPNNSPYSGCMLDHAPRTEPARSEFQQLRRNIAQQANSDYFVRFGEWPDENDNSCVGLFALDIGAIEDDSVIEVIALRCGEIRKKDAHFQDRFKTS